MNKDKTSSFVIVIVFLALATFFLAYNGTYKKIQEEDIKYVALNETKIKVDLATTEAEQVKGLSGRESLNEKEGMLFIFDRPGKHYFWMKDMNFPIDMIWIDEDLEIIYIKKDAKPDDFLQTFGPDEDTKYVLEVVAGFSDK